MSAFTRQFKDRNGDPTDKPEVGGLEIIIGPDGQPMGDPKKLRAADLRQFRAGQMEAPDPYALPMGNVSRRDQRRANQEVIRQRRAERIAETNNLRRDYDATVQTAAEQGYRPGSNRLAEQKVMNETDRRKLDKENQRIKRASDNTEKAWSELGDRDEVISKGRVTSKAGVEAAKREQEGAQKRADFAKARQKANLDSKKAAIAKENAQRVDQGRFNARAEQVNKDMAEGGEAAIKDSSGRIVGSVRRGDPKAKGTIDGIAADKAIRIATETAEDKRAEQEGLRKPTPAYETRIAKVKQDAADVAAAGKRAGDAARNRYANRALDKASSVAANAKNTAEAASKPIDPNPKTVDFKPGASSLSGSSSFASINTQKGPGMGFPDRTRPKTQTNTRDQLTGMPKGTDALTGQPWQNDTKANEIESRIGSLPRPSQPASPKPQVAQTMTPGGVPIQRTTPPPQASNNRRTLINRS